MNWTALWYELPGDPATADALLAGPLASLLAGAVEAGQLGAWYFVRHHPRWLRLSALDAYRPVLLARLTGLLGAVHHALGIGAPTIAPAMGPEVELPAPILARCTALSVRIIADTPIWQHRLRAAYDLAVADALVRAAVAGPGGAPAILDPVPARGRWAAMDAALRAGRDPAAGWAECLSDLDDRGAASCRGELSRLLHNQLGLALADSQRISAALRYTLTSRSPVRARRSWIAAAGCPLAGRRALDG